MAASRCQMEPMDQSLPPKLKRVPLDDRADDVWALDELMTAQPEATQAYFRDRLKRTTEAAAASATQRDESAD